MAAQPETFFTWSFCSRPSSAIRRIASLFSCSTIVACTVSALSRVARKVSTLLDDEARVIVDVAERRRLRCPGDLHDDLLEPVEHRHERRRRVLQVDDLALQPEDALGDRGVPREELVLDLVDVVLDARDDRQILVDDDVADRPHHGVRARDARISGLASRRWRTVARSGFSACRTVIT